MSSLFDDLKKLFGTDDETEDEQARFERERDRVAKAFTDAGLSEKHAKDLATKFVTGYLDYGSGRGGLHPDQIAELIERNVFTFGTRRLVLDIGLASDEYHLDLKVLAADKDAADQLGQVAKAIQQRKIKGEPS